MNLSFFSARGPLRPALAAIALALALLGGPGALGAQELAVPVEIHVPILAKILNFDRSLSARAQGQLVVGVLYQGKYPTSAEIAAGVHQVLKQLPQDAVAGLQVRCVHIDLDKTTDLAAALRRQRVTVLYVSPLRAVALETLTDVSRSSGITTVTGVPRYVHTGLAVGIDMKGERPQIMVNLTAARAEGADFTAQLLQLAMVIEKGGT